MRICPLCGKVCSNNKGLTLHYRACYDRNQNSTSNNERIDANGQNMLPPTDVYVGYRNSNTNFQYNESAQMSIANSNRETLELNLTQENNTQLSSEQQVLMNQEAEFQQRLMHVETLWSAQDLAKLELLKILDKHNCHNTAFEDIMEWHDHYLRLAKETKDKYTYDYMGREHFLKKLISRRQ